MSASLARGTLTISIDLDCDVARLAGQAALEDLTGRLLELLARYQMPATWAVADPAVSAARGRVCEIGAGHELAILGDATWVGREAGRSRFARELARRAARARVEGLPIDTLALKTVLPIEHCDLAIKEGIVAVRQARAALPADSARALGPATLRFGLWAFPASVTLPGHSRWLPGGGGVRMARVAIDEAIAARGLAQLVVDAPRLAARGKSALNVVARVLAHADRRRRHELLEIATLGATARKLAGARASQPSRSILRPAA
jgi:hypothetical protein